MSDSERKIFPIESVLALVTSKKDSDLKEIAGYIVGQSIPCDVMAHAAGPFAAAWLSRLYPKFADLVWDEEKEGWSSFVVRCSRVLGDKVSLPPMAGNMQQACQAMLKSFADKHAEVLALQKEVASLSAQVESLKPLEGKLTAAQKRADQLDEQLKAQKKDMGALRRQTMEFQGKMAVDQEELLEAIKSAIKDNLKNIAVAAAPAVAAAGAAGAAAGAAAATAAAAGGDEFGFGGGSGDEFGFGGGSGDEFGFGGGFGGDASEPAAQAEPADEFGFGDSKKDEFGF